MLILLSEFKVFKDNIPETNGWITETILPLAPSSDYNVRLRATNQRPVIPNYSEYVIQRAKTKGKFNRIKDGIVLNLLQCVIKI